MSESADQSTTPTCGVRNRDISVADHVMRSVSHLVPQLQKLVKKSDANYLMARYRIGALLVEAKRDIESAEETARIYRKKFWELFADAIGIHVRTLRYCLIFANEFTEADVEKMAKAGINWSHVTVVLGLPDSENRAEWMQRVAAEKLTVAALDDEVKAKYGNRRPGSGRKSALPKPPKTSEAALKRAINDASRLNLVHQHALFADEDSLVDRLMQELPDDQKRDQLVRLISEYTTLGRTLDEIVPQLSNALCRMDRILSNGISAEEPSAGDGTMPTDPAPTPQRTRRPPPTLRVVAPPTA